jgi:hypothetical protein
MAADARVGRAALALGWPGERSLAGSSLAARAR